MYPGVIHIRIVDRLLRVFRSDPMGIISFGIFESVQPQNENLGDVEDIEGEIELIKAWVEFLEEAKAKAVA